MKNIEEKFNDYLNNKLSNEETNAFEQALASDKGLQEQFSSYKVLFKHLESRALKNSSIAELKKVHTEQLGKSRKTPKSSSRSMLYVILAFLALILISWIIYSTLGDSKNAQEPSYIYAANFEVPNIDLNVRSDQNLPENVLEGEKAFRNGDYVKAAKLLDTLQVAPKFHSQILLAKATALHLVDKNGQAIEIFQNLGLKDTSYTATTNYYLGLIALDLDQTLNAKNSFKKVNKNSSYYSRSKYILESLGE